MIYQKELDFEKDLINVLNENGWEKTVLKNPTEQDLIDNWAKILFDNNRSIDRLNNYPLTKGEMSQLLEQITQLRTPIKLNGFINGKTVSIKRDNPDDKEHLNKEVSLKIYDRKEIAAGQSRYQIAEQPIFARTNSISNDRRGDLMLLINGMPVIHIELKRSGIPVSQACNQIRKYSHEGMFSGIFSLVQIFVAMNPEETLYFANPGPEGKFNSDFYFHWANFDNVPMNEWKKVATSLLSIPRAHELIGFYTVADTSDGVLKVMRSYQYYAANAISDKVSKTKWDSGNQRGGYIWHTTGSGKTMTSFKSAQLISSSNDADKVVFLTDRIELGTQSLKEYRAFADERETVQATENTSVLITKLKSNSASDMLIVTSIQKMSNIKDGEEGIKASDIALINKKRLVFIVDEAHRSTFGDMLTTIKATFPNAIFFGFTGTPVFEENAKKNNAQTDVFGNQLHRYSIADGIRDKNVLGFDLYKVLTFKDKDIREQVALEKAKAKNIEEVFTDKKKTKIYYEYMDPNSVRMAGFTDYDGKYVKGIEDYIPNSQYLSYQHQNKVVEDIKENWKRYSHNSLFHALFATSSIPEAIDYYRLLKNAIPDINISCLFDPTISNEDGDFKEYKGKTIAFFKQEGLTEIMSDYNKKFGLDFDLARHAQFKKDIALRLAHKELYKRIENEPEKQLNLLIVVDQMLTGFDSKWINTLYLDKVLEYENLIQAFSRTNRLYSPNEKPFGIIRYYRKPHTMQANIEKAVKLYSGDRPFSLFVDKLPYNIKKLNNTFKEIKSIFDNSNINNFKQLPKDVFACAKFVSLFKALNECLEAAKIQGFKWNKDHYNDEENHSIVIVDDNFTENTYDALLQRYKEISKKITSKNTSDDLPFDIVGYLTEIDTGVIDSEYMNSRFEKYLKLREQDDATEEMIEKAENELHKSFAVLKQEEQKYANMFLHDIESGDAILREGNSLRDYINEYQHRAEDDRVSRVSNVLGLNQQMLRDMMKLRLTENNINEFCRFDNLLKTVDKAKAKLFFEKIYNKKLVLPQVNRNIDLYLRKFILSGGLDAPFLCNEISE